MLPAQTPLILIRGMRKSGQELPHQSQQPDTNDRTKAMAGPSRLVRPVLLFIQIDDKYFQIRRLNRWQK